MKKVATLLSIVFVLALGLASCKGSAAKKGVDYIRKNHGSIEKLVKPKRPPKVETIKKVFGSQSRAIPCARCSQRGFLYRVDNYGNILRDYYGNPMVVTCPNCGGRGEVTISE